LKKKYGAFKKHASAFMDEAMAFASGYNAVKTKGGLLDEKQPLLAI
jgi:hypothetical protein